MLDHEDQVILLIFGVVLLLLLIGVAMDTVVYMRQERSETDKRE